MTDYGILMWGAEVTAANYSIDLQRTGNGGGNDHSVAVAATLDTTPTRLPDFIPSGDGQGWDLLKSMEDALDTADAARAVLDGIVASTYTCEWEVHATTGMTGNITTTNDDGYLFNLDWSTATLDPAWFGHGISDVFYPGQTYTDSTGAATYTSPYQSNLVWLPQQPAFSIQWYEPYAEALTVQRKTVNSKYVTRRVSYRSPMHSKDWGNLTGYGGALGGEMLATVEAIEHDFVHPQDTEDGDDINKSLANWFDIASQGRWFIIVKNNAAPGLDADSRVQFAKLTNPEALSKMLSLAPRQGAYSPQLWDINIPCTVIDIPDLGAGGS